MGTLFGIVIFLFAVAAIVAAAQRANMTPEQSATLRWGRRNPALICPHCQNKGEVRSKPLKRKAGISGAKATGAVLTAGMSVLATGLSRKENVTQAHCDHCNSTWIF